MFRLQEGSRGIIHLKHSTEQKSDIQLVALSNFAVISAEYHAGLADTGKKNRVGPQKKSDLAYYVMQWEAVINRVFTRELVLLSGSRPIVKSSKSQSKASFLC